MRRWLYGTSGDGSYIFGQLAFVPDMPDVPDDPEGALDPVEPVDPVDGVLVDGVVVLVAALAATAPPATRAPETAMTAMAFRMGLMYFTSLLLLDYDTSRRPRTGGSVRAHEEGGKTANVETG